MSFKVLHLCYIEKFTPEFIELIRRKVKNNIHKFITMGQNNEKYPIKIGDDLHYLPGKYLRYFRIIKEMNTTDKIVIHGLFDPGIILLLFLQPWLLKKCYWVMWGGDIYTTASQGVGNTILEFCKKKVAKNIGNLVTYIEGDFEFVKKRYNVKGTWKYCIMYPSNCFKKANVRSSNKKPEIDIQVGNSADPTNEHEFIFNKISNSQLNNVRVFSPLSYGDRFYASTVEAKAKVYFGSKFIAMYDFMEPSNYTQWQSSIDIAIFAHRRQQGMGNILTLLGLGKTVYLRSDVSSAVFLTKLGLKLGRIDKDEVELFSDKELQKNIEVIENEFSESMLVKQIEEIFN